MAVEVVAHRAGNDTATLTAAAGRTVEVDVHRGRGGRLEVRHGKRLWPTSRLWERWYLLPPGAEDLRFDELLDAAGADVHLWLDLKGPDPRLARAVAALVVGRSPLTVSTKAWWVLGPFLGRSGVRTMRSAGNRVELALLRWLPSRIRTDGSVVHSRLLDESTMAWLHGRGPVFTWSIPDVATRDRLLGLGVDGLILDDLTLAPSEEADLGGPPGDP